MEDRKLDVWGIYRDPEHVLDALKIIVDHKDEIKRKGALKLFTNCTSKFIIDGKNVGRYMDTLICSREADIALCLSSARYTDEKLGEISATPAHIAKFLDKYDIPYEIITGESQKDDIDNPKTPEIWMVREKAVLEESIAESIERGCKDCSIFPKIKSKLSMGYFMQNGEFKEIWGVNFKGLIKTDNSWTLLINEDDKRNLSMDEAKEIITKNGLEIKKEENPVKEYEDDEGR